MSVGINFLNIVIWLYLITSHSLKDSIDAHVVGRHEVEPMGHPCPYGASTEGLEGNHKSTSNDPG